MKNNLSAQEYKALVISIGESMGALINISQALYVDFPDILPKELKPSETTIEQSSVLNRNRRRSRRQKP
jgi:hypothetical protein